MRSRTCALSALALSTAMFFGTAMAADLPKEGTYSGTYSSFGTFKATPIGKERLLVTFDENGLSVTNGLLDHMTWHCWGGADFRKGLGQASGYCVGTDPSGDQIAYDFSDDAKRSLDQKSWNGTSTLTTGTGKYAGISGQFKTVLHPGEFRPATEGTYFQYVTLEGSYKLP